jgi:folate-dependent phosphoribosylglycinamide formyltransferase PurN
MNTAPRVVLLTGDGLRHAYVAQQLASGVSLVGVLCEAKAPSVAQPQALSQDDRATINRHFAERDEVEQRLLGDLRTPPLAELNSEWKKVSHGSANSREVHTWLKRLNPRFVVLFGTSVIKPPLLDEFEGRMINIHSGLSPYYRGGGTNFWPLYYGEPECVGTTIHLAEARIDAGPILAQVRPETDAADRIHELGTKALMAGVALVPRVLESWAANRCSARPQNIVNGRVCRRRDFTAAAVGKVWERLDRGMIGDYLRNLAQRQAKFPLVHPS